MCLEDHWEWWVCNEYALSFSEKKATQIVSTALCSRLSYCSFDENNASCTKGNGKSRPKSRWCFLLVQYKQADACNLAFFSLEQGGDIAC
jgi:hypothetical protein